VRLSIHDTDLGRWTMYACRPAALGHVVDGMWEVSGTVANACERIFPSGTIDIVMNLGPDQRLVRPGGADVFASGAAWVSGMQQRPFVMESGSEVHVVGVRLRPVAAAALLSVPMSVASGRIVPLSDLRRDAAAVFANLSTLSTFADRVAAVCRWIEGRCGTNPRCSGYVEWMVRCLERSGGSLAIDPLRRSAGVSRKKAAADFHAQVGATPKALARILRFRRARLLLQQQPSSVAHVAAACGYFDQSHMVRDFRALGDVTPGQFLTDAYPDGESAVV
ncbi:MAG TPA: helix-turn-helix domain-containing protein, partial [Vicinamibacterales bacterium]|nr:helix-turn-helix domain-containing protein [Vicinamibacterales bacterium]